jgi:hypothetical protein
MHGQTRIEQPQWRRQRKQMLEFMHQQRAPFVGRFGGAPKERAGYARDHFHRERERETADELVYSSLAGSIVKVHERERAGLQFVL